MVNAGTHDKAEGEGLRKAVGAYTRPVQNTEFKSNSLCQ